MKYVVRSIARQDILRQFLYLLDQDAAKVAHRFLEAVETTLAKLTHHPRIGTPKKLKDPRLKGLRRWPVQGFEIIEIYYLLAEDCLKVIRVLHSKRDIARIFNEKIEP